MITAEFQPRTLPKAFMVHVLVQTDDMEWTEEELITGVLIDYVVKRKKRSVIETTITSVSELPKAGP